MEREKELGGVYSLSFVLLAPVVQLPPRELFA